MRICVFCGSSTGLNPAFVESTRVLGHQPSALATRGNEAVYGGGNVGLMAVLADAVLEAGGRITGVIPQALVARELAHQKVTKLHVVSSMHERKALMAELSDGFIALPGGFGTLEEFCEAVTWTQLGVHTKPCGLLNICGFYDSLLTFLAHALAEEFLRPTHREIVVADSDPSTLLDRIAAWKPPAVTRWLAPGQEESPPGEAGPSRERSERPSRERSERPSRERSERPSRERSERPFPRTKRAALPRTK